MSDFITIQGNKYVAQWIRPWNPEARPGGREQYAGGAQDDKTMQKVGLRGGFVPAAQHWQSVPPMLLKAFGQRWWEKGSASMYFHYGVVEGEDIRTMIEIPPKGAKDVQVGIQIEDKQDHTVMKGTAAVGEPKGAITELRDPKLFAFPPGDIRILKNLKVGDKPAEKDVTLEEFGKGSPGNIEERVPPADGYPEADTLLKWYKEKSPWGGTIATPSGITRVLMMHGDVISKATGRQPGAIRSGPTMLWGALEVHNINGPIKVGVTYHVTGKVAYIGSSRSTEYFFLDTQCVEKSSGKVVTDMRHKCLFMKDSSPLWAGEKK